MNIIKELDEWRFLLVSLIPHKVHSKIYSYKDLLTFFLLKFKPKKIIEFGTGKSTNIMADLLKDSEIVTIEHQRKWYYRWKWGLSKRVKILLLDDNYSNPDYPDKYFDFAFIDGKDRENCMKSCFRLLKEGGYVMLHDYKDYRIPEGLIPVLKDDMTILLKINKKVGE